MAKPSLTHSSQSQHYSIKEFQLLVKDAPVVPAEIQPFVGIQFRSSVDIFRPAIANMTAGLIFIHNHPSGDPAPSDEDLQITKRLCEVGKLIGIKCLDHIIIGSGRYFSFADQGLI